MDYFGERVVRGKLDLWVQKYWRDGNMLVFWLSNRCWQVLFWEGRDFRIYAVDEKGIGWSRDVSESPDVLYKVREILERYMPLVGSN